MRCMILYLIAAFALGAATGTAVTVLTAALREKYSRRKNTSVEGVTKCFLELLRH